MDATRFPEMAKMAASKHETQIIKDFLDFLLESKGYEIMERVPGKMRDTFHPIDESIDELIAESVGIDLKKFQKEKDQALEEALEHQRKINEAKQ